MHPPLVLVCSKKDSLPFEPPGKPLQKGKEAYYGLWRLHKSSWTQRMYYMVALLRMKSVYKNKNMWRHASGRRVLPHTPEKGSRQPRSCAHFSLHSRSRSAGGLHPRFTCLWQRGALSSSRARPPVPQVPGPAEGDKQRWSEKRRKRRGLSSLPLTSCTILGPRCCVSSKAFIFYLKKGE